MPKFRILIEASKLYMCGQDGVKRYLTQLVQHLYLIQNDDFEIDLLFGKDIIALKDFFIIKNKGSLSKNPVISKKEKTLFKLGITMFVLNIIMRIIGSRKRLKQFYESRYYPVMLTRLTRLGKGRYRNLIKTLQSYDLIHVALPQNLLFFKEVDANFVVTLHDITHRLFPQFHTKDNILRSEQGIALMQIKGAGSIAVSQASANDFAREYGTSCQGIRVIYEAANPHLFQPKEQVKTQATKQKYGLEDKPYFLCLATLEPRKNMMNGIRAFEALKKEYQGEILLVLAGGKGWKNKDIKRELHISHEAVRFIGFVEDEDLPALYSGAISLLYPSYYEGFGLPLVEAMSCGTPVLYGNNSSMPEVVGKGGIPLVPNDIKGMKEALLRILEDEVFRNELGKEALAQAAGFSWELAAVETLVFYRDFLADK